MAKSNGNDSSGKADLLDEIVSWTIRETGETRSMPMRSAYERYAVPTKSGEKPPLRKVREFLAICRNRGLDPDAGDAWLLGYDSSQGAQFSIVVSYQSLAKRAEANDAYDGMESGIVIIGEDGFLEELQGVIVPLGATLVGGWARVWRKDRKFPSIARLPLEGYDKNRSLWNTIKSTMICKCAKAAAMRDAFPSDCGDLYTSDEVGETVLDKAIAKTETQAGKVRATERISAMATPVSRTINEDADDPPEVVVEAPAGHLFVSHPNAAEE